MNKPNTSNVLNGFANVLEKLGQLAEKGEQLKRTVHEIDSQKTPYAERVVSVQSSNHQQTIREPRIEVIENTHDVLITVEMPGIGRDDIQFEVTPYQLNLQAQRQQWHYQTAIRLPTSCRAEQLQLQCINGIAEFRYPKS